MLEPLGAIKHSTPDSGTGVVEGKSVCVAFAGVWPVCRAPLGSVSGVQGGALEPGAEER